MSVSGVAPQYQHEGAGAQHAQRAQHNHTGAVVEMQQLAPKGAPAKPASTAPYAAGGLRTDAGMHGGVPGASGGIQRMRSLGGAWEGVVGLSRGGSATLHGVPEHAQHTQHAELRCAPYAMGMEAVSCDSTMCSSGDVGLRILATAEGSGGMCAASEWRLGATRAGGSSGSRGATVPEDSRPLDSVTLREWEAANDGASPSAGASLGIAAQWQGLSQGLRRSRGPSGRRPLDVTAEIGGVALPHACLAPPIDLGVAAPGVDERLHRLGRQLDSFGADDLFLGKFRMLGRAERRRGGAAPSASFIASFPRW